MGFLGIGYGELLLVLVIALMIFGPSKLPQFARNLGKAAYQFRKYSNALTKDFRAGFDDELKSSLGEKREKYQPKGLSASSHKPDSTTKDTVEAPAENQKEEVQT